MTPRLRPLWLLLPALALSPPDPATDSARRPGAPGQRRASAAAVWRGAETLRPRRRTGHRPRAWWPSMRGWPTTAGGLRRGGDPVPPGPPGRGRTAAGRDATYNLAASSSGARAKSRRRSWPRRCGSSRSACGPERGGRAPGRRSPPQPGAGEDAVGAGEGPAEPRGRDRPPPDEEENPIVAAAQAGAGPAAGRAATARPARRKGNAEQQRVPRRAGVEADPDRRPAGAGRGQPAGDPRPRGAGADVARAGRGPPAPGHRTRDPGRPCPPETHSAAAVGPGAQTGKELMIDDR